MNSLKNQDEKHYAFTGDYSFVVAMTGGEGECDPTKTECVGSGHCGGALLCQQFGLKSVPTRACIGKYICPFLCD